MAFLKKKWRMIAFGLACLLSIGAAAWAHMSSSSIEEEVKSIDALLRDIKSDRANAVNLEVIEARKKQVIEENGKLSESLGAALSKQRNNSFYEKVDANGNRVAPLRAPLMPNILPKQGSRADAIQFRDLYRAEFKKLAERLHASDKASPDEIGRQEAILTNAKQSKNPFGDNYAWGPSHTLTDKKSSKDEVTGSLPELLPQYAEARAAEATAREIWMYLDPAAIGPHPLAENKDVPNDVDIWQAQMSLWIQQDIVTAIARLNEKRAAELTKAGRDRDVWVANLPVKRLQRFSIRDRLGRGGGSNGGYFAQSFTGIKNDQSMFVVPLQLELVVEEASLVDLLDSICRVGFYTPINVQYTTIEPDILQEEYIYGSAPVISVIIDLEGYYFRKVFDPWIPEVLKKALATPETAEDLNERNNG